MGNLGRAGHGASTDGMWPFSYDACDVGTFPNQTYPGTSLPAAAMEGGDPFADGELVSATPPLACVFFFGMWLMKFYDAVVSPWTTTL